MTAHEAQADNLAVERAASILVASAAVLKVQADRLRERPNRHIRAALKRALSGVLADVEKVRVAVKD